MNRGIAPLQLTLPLWRPEQQEKRNDEKVEPLCDTPSVRHVHHAPIRGYKLLDSEGCAHGYTFQPFGPVLTADLTAVHEMCRRPSNRIRSFRLFRQWCWSLEAPHALCHSPLPETVPTLFDPPWSGPELGPTEAERQQVRVVMIETSFEQVLAVGSTWLLSAQFRIVLELSWSDYLARCTGPFLRLDGTLEYWTRGHLHREPIRQPSERQHRECQRELDRYRRLSMLGHKSNQLNSESMMLRSESLDETRVPSHQLALRHFELTYHPFAMADLRHLLLTDDELDEDLTENQWVEMPAVYNADGTIRYYRCGQRHRTQGPAIVTPDGRGVWFTNDRLMDVTERSGNGGDQNKKDGKEKIKKEKKSRPSVPSLELPKVRINVMPNEELTSPPRKKGQSARDNNMQGRTTHRRFLFSPRFWNLLTPKSRKQLRTTWSESSLDRLEKNEGTH